MKSFTTYEAKARFSELLRRVREGEVVRITYYGEEVAELRPIERQESVEHRIKRLVVNGVLEPASDPDARLNRIADRPGALARFLEERD